jgi:hypothetical protein
MKNGVFWVVTPCGWFLQEPHGVTTEKTPFFIVTAMNTSNLTRFMHVSSRLELTRASMARNCPMYLEFLWTM